MTRVPDEAGAAMKAVEIVLGRAPVAAYLSGKHMDANHATWIRWSTRGERDRDT